ATRRRRDQAAGLRRVVRFAAPLLARDRLVAFPGFAGRRLRLFVLLRRVGEAFSPSRPKAPATWRGAALERGPECEVAAFWLLAPIPTLLAFSPTGPPPPAMKLRDVGGREARWRSSSRFAFAAFGASAPASRPAC